MKPTPEQLAKLPKWAAEYIKEIERQRETAISALNEYTDNQTVSPLFADELECLEAGSPRHIIRYFQGREIQAKFMGVHVRMYLCETRKRIEIQYSREDDRTGDVCLQPSSHQSFSLIAPKCLRD